MTRKRKDPSAPMTPEEFSRLLSEYNMESTFRALAGGEKNWQYKRAKLLGHLADEGSPPQGEPPSGAPPVHPGNIVKSPTFPESNIATTPAFPENNIVGTSSFPEDNGAEKTGMPAAPSPASGGKGRNVGECAIFRSGNTVESTGSHSGNIVDSPVIPEGNTVGTPTLLEVEDRLQRSAINIQALKQNPMTAWTLVPMDYLDDLGKILRPHPLRVNWSRLNERMDAKQIQGSLRVVLRDLFAEADRAKSNFVVISVAELLEKSLGTATGERRTLRKRLREVGEFVAESNWAGRRGTLFHLADTLFFEDDGLDLIKDLSISLSPPKQVLGELNFSQSWSIRRLFRYHLAGLPVQGADQNAYLATLEKRFSQGAWGTRASLRDISPGEAPIRNAMQAGVLSIWEIVQGRRPDSGNAVNRPVPYLRKCVERDGDFLTRSVSPAMQEKWKAFIRMADSLFEGNVHLVSLEELAGLASSMGIRWLPPEKMGFQAYLEQLSTLLDAVRNLLESLTGF